MATSNLSTRDVENKIRQCIKEINKLKEQLNREMKEVKKVSSTLGKILKSSLNFPNVSVYMRDPHIKMSFKNEVYNVINSPNMSLTDLYSFIKTYKLDQSRPEWDAACLQIAEAYGRRLFYRDYDLLGNARVDGKRINKTDVFISGANNYWNDHWININANLSKNPDLVDNAKKQVIDIMYEELSNGKPCVLQVEQHQNDGNIGRHYVTVVGIKESATKDGVTENDFLILDPGGGIKQLGVERHVYAAPNNPNEASCRVLTLIDEQGVIDNVNKERKGNGYNSKITELTYSDGG